MEDGWLLLKKKAEEEKKEKKVGGRKNGNHSHTGSAAAAAEPCLLCWPWRADWWSVDWSVGGRLGGFFPSLSIVGPGGWTAGTEWKEDVPELSEQRAGAVALHSATPTQVGPPPPYLFIFITVIICIRQIRTRRDLTWSMKKHEGHLARSEKFCFSPIFKVARKLKVFILLISPPWFLKFF